MLSAKSIEYALGLNCESTRSSGVCPNGMLCKNVLNRSTGPTVVLALRQSLWQPQGAAAADITPRKRRERLEATLVAMRKLRDDASFEMRFVLNGEAVCKYFYKVSIATVYVLLIME